MFTFPASAADALLRLNEPRHNKPNDSNKPRVRVVRLVRVVVVAVRCVPEIAMYPHSADIACGIL